MKDEIQKLIDKYEKDKEYLSNGVWYGDDIGYERDHAKIDKLEEVIEDLKNIISEYEDQIKNDLIMKLLIDYDESCVELSNLSIDELTTKLNSFIKEN